MAVLFANRVAANAAATAPAGDYMDEFDAYRTMVQDRRRESKYLDFKAGLDVTSAAEWLEVIKDIVAMANSGGGVIVLGVDDSGRASGADITGILGFDPASLTDKIAKYTGVQYHEFGIEQALRDGAPVAALFVGGISMPMVFVIEGGYVNDKGKNKTAFQKGTVYFRHGAKSEPCTGADLANVISQNVETLRKNWLKNIAKVVHAPVGHEVVVRSAEAMISSGPGVREFRPSDDPDAPEMRIMDRDDTWPYRLKELTKAVQEALDEGAAITQGELQAVRKNLDIDKRKEFMSLAKYGSPQYSKNYVAWLVMKYKEDNQFFAKHFAEFKQHQTRS